MTKKICVIGHFGFGQELLNGQTIKTKIIANELVKKFGSENVSLLDLAGGIKKIPNLLLAVPKTLAKTDHFVMLPVENGLLFLTPLLSICNHFYKKKLHYVVIGGWLPDFLQKKVWLQKGLKRFEGIYVETNTMKKALEQMGFQNIYVLPNCKNLSILSEDELVYPEGVPLRLCTFSRVMRLKGIETAVRVVQEVNEYFGYTAFSLDIYGQIWDADKEWFKNLSSHFPKYIVYKGAVEANRSVDTLKDYFALLFPTHFYTEGIPGTIIDAYSAGIPVISSKWESFADVIDDGITGIGYDFNNYKQFKSVLVDVATNPNKILALKKNCVNKAKSYIPESAIKSLANILGGGVYKLYPLKVCTFSRVMKEKGIGDAVNAIMQVNESLGYTALELDIYGQIWEESKAWFEELRKRFPDYVNYVGVIPFDKSVEVLKNYFALLFPTYYEGEGFAGTLIDAYSAGVPVIATDWKYNAELVPEDVGYVYKSDNQEQFIEILKEVATHPYLMLQKKTAALREARRFQIDVAVQVLIEQM